MKDIPRRDILKFRSWLRNRPEQEKLKTSFLTYAEQERVLNELYETWVKEEATRKQVTSAV